MQADLTGGENVRRAHAKFAQSLTDSGSGAMSKREDLRFLFWRFSWRMKYFWAWLAICECVLEGTKCVEMPFQSPCRAKPGALMP